MSLFSIMEQVEMSSMSLAIAESTWLFPTIETFHVFAISLVVGSIAMLDLRLLGFASRDRGVIQLTAEVLPWTWGAFIVAVISGSLLFITSATRYFELFQMQAKLVLLVLAGVNMAIFHMTVYRAVFEWDRTLPTPPAARIAATLSLAFWVAVVVLGRWIGFV